MVGEMEERVEGICEQLKAGTYRALPVRRVEIPKGPGKSGTRPLGIPSVADRLLQRAVARTLEAVFEADFLDRSFDFRPGRNPHHGLRALRSQIVAKKGESRVRNRYPLLPYRASVATSKWWPTGSPIPSSFSSSQNG